MWWNGFLFKKYCVKLQFFFNCCFFFVVCYTLVFVSFLALALVLHRWFPSSMLINLNDLKKVIPIKLETQLYLLILSLSTWGYFYAHCWLRLLIFPCNYLIYILFFWYCFSDVWPMCSIKALDKKKWESKYYCFKRVMKRQKMMLYDKSLPD